MSEIPMITTMSIEKKESQDDSPAGESLPPNLEVTGQWKSVRNWKSVHAARERVRVRVRVRVY